MNIGRALDFLFNQIRSALGDIPTGTLYFYAAGTTTPKAVYTARDMSGTAYTSYTLSSDSQAALFGLGLYKIVVKDSNGVTIYTFDNVSVFPSEMEGGGAVKIDASGGNQSVTIDTGVLAVTYSKSDATANTVTINPPGGYTIMGLATYVL